jgi:DNA-binding Xre family transcriptional regulator
MEQTHYWDDESYIRIDDAGYDAQSGTLTVSFRDGETVRVSAWRLLRPDQRDPRWDHLEVVDNYYIHVPAEGMAVDVPGTTIRALTDPAFAAHLAREAEVSARHVGARLQALRKARGLTTQQVGERVGMAQQNLSRIEQGRHAVSFPTLEKILAAMGYTLEDILPDEPISSPPTP